MGSPLKVYIENVKSEILDRKWNEYENLPEDADVEQIIHDDQVVWAVLENIEAICKRRGRY